MTAGRHDQLLAGPDAEMSSDEAEAAAELDFPGSESEDASSEHLPFSYLDMLTSLPAYNMHACIAASSVYKTCALRLTFLTCCSHMCSQLWRIRFRRE